jgi:hypothetical protein
VQRIFLFQVLFQRAIGIGPRAEVVQFAPDFLAPLADGVVRERIFWVGLGGLASRGRLNRIVLGDDDYFLWTMATVFAAKVLHHPGHFVRCSGCGRSCAGQ